MRVTWRYRPLRVYEPFHASSDRERLLVGGFGSGKTYALCADAIAAGLQVPGARIMLTRRTIPEVRDTLEPVFLDVLPHELYMAGKVTRGGGHMQSFTLPNGTEFLFRSIDDWQKLKSLNLGRIYWDELSEFDLASYVGMLGRLRQVEPTAAARAAGYNDPIPEWFRSSAAASNPAGHDWMWGRWVRDADEHRKLWTATSLDNPHLPEDYLATLLAMPDDWVKRYVLCSFDEFGGLIYPDWAPETHVLKTPVPLTKASILWHGIDPGSRHPTAMLWVAVVDRTLIAVHEELASDRSVEDWAKVIRRFENQPHMPQVRWRVGDPNSMHVRDRGTMVSLHAQYRRQGFNFQNGPSRTQDRIPMLGTLVKARRFRGTRATPQFNRQMEAYRWEDLTASMRTKLGEHADSYGPERPVQVDDDLVDVAQYLSSRFVRPVKKRAVNPRDAGKTQWQLESDDLRARERRFHMNKRRQAPAESEAGLV